MVVFHTLQKEGPNSVWIQPGRKALHLTLVQEVWAEEQGGRAAGILLVRKLIPFQRCSMVMGLHNVTLDLCCATESSHHRDESAVEKGFTCPHCHQPPWEQPVIFAIDVRRTLWPGQALPCSWLLIAGGSSLKDEQEFLSLV